MKHTRSIIRDHLAQNGKSPSPENIRSFIDKNRKKIKKLIVEYKEINGENFEILDFITFVREKFELPSQIPLDAFIKLITYSVTTGNTLDYDEVLKLIPQDTRKSDNLKIVKKEKLIKNQGEHLAQGLVEIIANACDASNPEVQVGRFGEGFFQSLRFLQEFENAKLSINTKKQGEKAFEISLVEEKNEVKVGSLTSKKQENGTIVSLTTKLDDKTLTYLNDFICSRFGTNPYINLYLNGKRLNDLEEFVYINGQKLDTSLLPVVNITLNESGFIAEDFGVGMDSKTICEKLLIPTSSSKLRTKMDIEETKKYADEHTRFFYKRNTKSDKKQKTIIRLQVAGVVNEEFVCETSSNISIFSLETPFFEWVPEAKNQVLPTRGVVLTIEKAISKIFDKCETLEEKVELSEIVGKIISKLKERKTNETEKKYTLDYIGREAFKPFLEELKESGKIVLPTQDELQKIIGNNENVIFVSPDFINFDITSLPGVKKIDSIIGETKPFYTMEFSQNATHDYLIHKTGILVNSKYLNSKTDSNISPVQILNTSINLNIGYEIQSDIVFYGRIDKDNLTLSPPTKKAKSEEFTQNQFNQNNEENLQKDSEEYKKMLEEKRGVLKEVLDEFLEEFDEGLKIFCEIATLKYGVIKRSVSMLLDKDELVLGIKNPKDFMNYAFFGKNIDYKIADNFIARLRQKTPEIQGNIFYFISLLTIYSEGLNDNNLPRDLNINQEIKDAILNKIELDKYIELIDKIFELFEAEPEFMSQVTKRLSSKNGKGSKNKMIFEIQKIINELEQIKETGEFPNQNTTKIQIDDTEYTGIEDIMDPKFAVFMEDEEVKKIINGADQDEWNLAEERILFKFKFDGNINLAIFDWEEHGKAESCLESLKSGIITVGNKNVYDCLVEYFKSDDKNKEYIDFGNKYNIQLWKIHGLYELFNIQNIIYQLKKNGFVKKEVEEEKETKVGENETIFEPLYHNFYFELLNCLSNFDEGNFDEIKTMFNKHYGYIFSLKLTRKSARILDGLFYNNALRLFIESGFFAVWINEPMGIWMKKYGINLKPEEMLALGDFFQFITPTPELKKRCLELQQEKKASENFQAESLSDPKYEEFMDDMRNLGAKVPYGGDILEEFKKSSFYKKYRFLGDSIDWIVGNLNSLIQVRSITNKDIVTHVRKFTDKNGKLLKDNWLKFNREFNKEYLGLSARQFFEQVTIYLLEKNLFNKQAPENSSTIAQIDKTIDELRTKLREYPQDLVAFGEFLDKGGEFLKSEKSVIKINGDKKFKLSELIAGYRLHNKELMDIEDEGNLGDFIQNILSKNYNCELFQNEIRSSIDGQDESAMIWVRELVQNSRDAILGSGNSGQIEINFYEEDGNWVSSVLDPAGMNLKQVFNYLLVPGESSKTGANSEGMFGQGFYATTIESKEIRVKTGVGDGKTTSLVFKPIFNEGGLIHDFEISYEIINEDFNGTLVERVDKASGIGGNLRALIGVHNIQKYVGNVDDVEVLYKGESIANTKELLETVGVLGYGEIKIFETSDKIERKTKNNLYIRDLPDDYLDDLPDWMSKFIKSRNISIEVPAGMELTKTRNSLAQREKNLPILRKYLFKGFVEMLLKSFVDRNTGIKIPMLPEDYLSLEDKYFNYSRQINRIADKYNFGEELNDNEIEILKNDSERMAQFLIQANFEYEGKITNLREMKQKILAKNRIESNSDMFNEYQNQSFFTSDNINRSMENAPRNYNISIKEMSEKLGVSIEQIKNFNNFMENNFSKLISNLYGGKFINSYYEREGGENGAARYRKIKGNIYMYWNVDNIKECILNFENPKMQEEIIEVTTHEIVHLLENKDKLGSHEKDLEHDKSFELIQRNLLTTMQRV